MGQHETQSDRATMEYSKSSVNSNSSGIEHSWFKSFILHFSSAFRTHLVGYQLSFAALGIAVIIVWATDQSMGVFLFFSISLAMVMLAIIGLAALVKFFRMILFEHPESPLREFVRWFRYVVMDPASLSKGLHAILIVNFMGMAYGLLKSSIPVLVPFSWDAGLMEFDQFLHFGWHPWEILQPVFGYPAVTFAMNFIYNIWFVIVPGFFVWVGFIMRDSDLRMQYLAASVIAWIVGGNLVATLFSSAGPCYYTLLGNAGDPYGPLMAYLNTANGQFDIWALNVQETLWKGYQNGEMSVISALPSMHIASSTLLAFVAYAHNRRFGYLMGVYAVLIFLASVHLGWHYAVDGYFGALIAWASWHFAGVLVRRDRARQDAAAQAIPA